MTVNNVILPNVKMKKADFSISGHFTGSRLSGREHEYLYHVYYKEKQLDRYGYTSKRKADSWLGAIVREHNQRLKQAKEKNIIKEEH